ncbi:hypothetical protein I3842_10G031800 [Carya illinoinensis]|uniref:endo-polygalacturonase n=1 Tax=Carya illinoinensis TaxID=32201 RepID=A0A922DU00_CARIL|nr:hypothetical protein I3842_10G031800 [Carya illinoinensis]
MILIEIIPCAQFGVSFLFHTQVKGELIMGQQRHDHLLPFLFIMMMMMISFNNIISCYSSASQVLLEDDRRLLGPYHGPDHHDHESHHGYDSQAYPSYNVMSTILNDEFKEDLIEEITNDVLSLKRIDHRVDSIFSSVKTVINVNDFGAQDEDGNHDDTEAFKKAWKVACSSSEGFVALVVPYKKYGLKPIRFSGPCKSVLTMQIYGTIEASEDQSDYSDDRRHWLVIERVENLIVEGGGTIDGNGKIWWQNSCKINKTLPCKHAPTAITFNQCTNLIVSNLKIQNAQQIHVSFSKCMNVLASYLIVTSPEKSPNTDGIHVTRTQNILISSCVIRTGDDCISIVNGSQNVLATDIACGPGHGISIGSLGSGNSEAHVSGILVDRAQLSGTTNGVRIKTWQGGSGSASNIKFQNVEMDNVTNPIIIDQNYCDQDKACEEQDSAVQVENVIYENIQGTSASDVAIKFDCSESFPCRGVLLQNINLEGSGGNEAEALCRNVEWADIGTVSPRCPEESHSCTI